MELEISHVILIYKREFKTCALMLYTSFDGFIRARLQSIFSSIGSKRQKAQTLSHNYGLFSSISSWSILAI